MIFMKKTQAFSLDEEIKAFIDGKQWEFKKNRSQIVNSVFKYFQKHPEELRRIIREENE